MNPRPFGRLLVRARAGALAVLLSLFAATAQAAFDADDFDMEWVNDELVIEFESVRTFDEAMLVAPDGTEFVHYSLDRERRIMNGHRDGPTGGVGIGGGSGGVGVGIGLSFPLFGDDDDQGVQYDTRAKIRVADMTDYLARWQDWKIRIHLTADSYSPATTLEFPAPEPD